MSLRKQNSNILNSHEKEFINCFSEFYQWKGRSETLGLVFGVLFLRTGPSKKGLTQKEITTLIGKSKSTISRILDLLIDQGFCRYDLEENDNTRAERRYAIKGSFKELTISRTQKNIEENETLQSNLIKISNKLTDEQSSQNKNLFVQIANFSDLMQLLNESEKHTLELLQNHYKDAS